MMEILIKYFPKLNEKQLSQFKRLMPLYTYWNSRINVISRKDIDDLYLKHVLHSLGIAKVIGFYPGTRIMDVGTGGGFPGIPLAIFFPEVEFHLVDSIGKKLKVINAVAEELGLDNVKTFHSRAEDMIGQYDFIVSRAVTAMPRFVGWISDKVKTENLNGLPNGVLYLKGGDLESELQQFPGARIYELKDYFEEEFFETKKLVYLSSDQLTVNN